MLAVQAFIPEIWLGGKTNRARFTKKYDYIFRWWLAGMPVLMDINPGWLRIHWSTSKPSCCGILMSSARPSARRLVASS